MKVIFILKTTFMATNEVTPATPEAPTPESAGGNDIEAVIEQILSLIALLPVEAQTQLLGLLNNQFQSVQQEETASPENQQAIADQMASLVA